MVDCNSRVARTQGAERSHGVGAAALARPEDGGGNGEGPTLSFQAEPSRCA